MEGLFGLNTAKQKLVIYGKYYNSDPFLKVKEFNLELDDNITYYYVAIEPKEEK